MIANPGANFKNIFMEEDLNKQSFKWVDQYYIILKNKGISHKYAPWYIRRVEEFMPYVGYTDPQGLGVKWLRNTLPR